MTAVVSAPQSSRNIAAIDAANIGLDFIARYVSPLATAIASLSEDNQDVDALCAVLRQEADNVHAILVCMRDSADNIDSE